MEGVIGGTFAEVLKEHRSALNAKFMQARRLHPNLDPQVFGELLYEVVDPIVAAVEVYNVSAVTETALTLYDLSLDLLGQGFLGPGSRYPFIGQGWKDLLALIPRQVCESPRRVVGAMTNALYNLSLVTGTRPGQWLETMLTLAQLSENVADFLRAGQIAAWHAGMAQYREGALELCEKIPSRLARVALGLPEAENVPAMDALVKRLSADPWLEPKSILQKSSTGKRRLAIVRRVGEFRGFGGLFRQPPTVAVQNGHFIVTDGETRWQLIADVFGATFHRVEGDFQPVKTTSLFSVSRLGEVGLDGQSRKFPELANYTSAASNENTLAVTTALSFAVSLIALTDEA